MQTITRQQANRLMRAPDPNCATGLRNRIILRLFYSAGLRVSEVVAARREDLNSETGTLTVGEDKARREVGLIDELETDLRRWLKLHHPGGDWLVCSIVTGHEGGQVSPSYLRQMVSREAEAAGLDPNTVSPSILRDSFGAELAAEGWTIPELAEVLGYVDPRAARRYCRTGGNVAARMRARTEQPALPVAERPAERETIRDLVHAAGDRRALARALVAELRDELREAMQAVEV